MIRVLSLFSGIGAPEMALKRLGVEHEIVGFSEVDKYAIKSYTAIHGDHRNLGDIRQVKPEDVEGDIDLVVAGFPCQDISAAGKQKGLFNEDGSLTRSGLFFDAMRLIRAKKPKVIVFENVKALASRSMKDVFDAIRTELTDAGYGYAYQVLNAKHYGVPQNRERVFIVCFRHDGLGSHNTEAGFHFKWPEQIQLTRVLRDVLEEDVPDKYYLSTANMTWLDQHNKRHEQKGTGFKFNPKDPEKDTASTLRANGAWCPTDNAIVVHGCKQIGYQEGSDKVVVAGRVNSSQDGVVVVVDGCAPTHTAGHGNMPKIVEPINAMPDGTEITLPEIAHAYRVGGRGSTDRHAWDTYAPDGYRIRKLTPLECWRLMDFPDEAFAAAKGVGISDTQLYKQAGNSIVVAVIEAVLKEIIATGVFKEVTE